MTSTSFARTITDLDYVRLYNLVQRQGAASDTGHLADLIDAAEQVRPQQVAPNIVTMLTRVRVADASGAERSLTLCYPHEADAAKGFISVLSPLGTSLLGLREGESAEWHGPDGKPATLVLRAIEFQPEANGDYTD